MNKGRGFQNSWWLMVITLGMIISASISFSFSLESNFFYMAISELSIIVPVIIGMYMIKREVPDVSIIDGIGLRGFDFRLLPLIVILPVAAQSFAGYLFLPLQALLTILFGALDNEAVIESSSFWQNFVAMCILAPIIEELLCRGVLMSLLRRYGMARMLIYSSLGFALLHLNMQSFIPIFMIGLLLGLIRITTGSVLAPMIAHAASNLYALISIGASAENQAAFVFLSAIAFPLFLLIYFRICEGSWRNGVIIKGSRTGVSFGLILVLAIFMIFNLLLLIGRFISGDIYYDINSMLYW